MAEGEGRFVEYAGGYSDMLAQRGRGVEAKETPPKVKKSSAPKKRGNPQDAARKMSFNDTHELETLPARIAALEREIAALHGQLSDSGFYARDPKGFAAGSASPRRK
jgi:ATP-binding cassette subfamily F protein uup